MTEGLQYHNDRNLPLCENIFRAGSTRFFELFREARNLYNQNLLNVTNEDDLFFLTETLLGEKDVYEGKEVYLDFPIPSKDTFAEILAEAKYQGKTVQLNKPKRGGAKKFYVYTRNPKSGKIIKVSFGAKDGGANLSVKLKDPKRRKAFADRHNCSSKNDKTKPGYWACRLNRYWKSLGGTSNYSGFW
jgi:hypothetical protein